MRVQAISGCKHLTSLRLAFHETLSDAGLAAAAAFPKLRMLQPALRCCCTRYTEAGVATLRRALPAGCELILPPPGLQRCYRPKPVVDAKGRTTATPPGDEVRT